MTFQNFLSGIAAILFGIMLWAIGFAVISLIWKAIVKVTVTVVRWGMAFCRFPSKTLFDSPFVVILIALPFLLIYEQLFKLIKPAEFANRKAIIKETQAKETYYNKFLTRHGATCLYKEDATLCCAKVESIRADEHGLWLKLIPIVSQGFKAQNEPWSCMVKWENFYEGDDAWYSEYYLVKWRIYFNPALMEKLKSYAETLPDEMLEIERFDALNTDLKRILADDHPIKAVTN